ncbi:MAG: efflux RND transporter periplasmic adaptor subunit [Paracoccus sp. (in: a-proteobacteria)]
MLRLLLALSVLGGPATALAETTTATAGTVDESLTAAGKIAPVAQAATVVAAAVTPIETRVPVSGSLIARQQAQVYPRVSGFEVTEILVEAGDEVAAGQVLARLSDETLKVQYTQAEAEAQRAGAAVGQAKSQIGSTEASLAQSVSALERARRLQRSGTATQAALDAAVSNEAVARAASASALDGLAVASAAQATADAARDIARLNLDRTDIVAPVAGVVISRNAEIGVLGSAGGDPMFVIAADGKMEWQAEVIETDLEKLSLGDAALASVAGVGEVRGEVRLLPAAIEPGTRLGWLRISLAADARLKPGLFASGWIITDRYDGISVPLEAVMVADEGDVVQVVKDGIVETRPVQAGAIWEGRREILSGLAAGEIVIARAGAFFRDGDRVVPANEDSADKTAGKDTASLAASAEEDGAAGQAASGGSDR